MLVGFEKHPRGKPQFLSALLETVFEADDTIFVVAEMDRAQRLIETHRLVEAHLDERQRAEALQQLGVAELMLAPELKLIGKPLGDAELRSRHRVAVLAIRHRGELLTSNLANQILDFGDTLLVAGDWADIGELWDGREDFVVLTLPAEYQERLPARQRAPVAIGILIAMVMVMAFQLVPNSAAALLAAMAMIAGGCVRVDAIYRIVNCKTVVLIAGMLPLATALTKTGATDLMAKELVSALKSLGPIATLAVVFVVMATGKTADAAYVLAGYQENRSNAARLNASQNIQRRVAEIQSIGAELAAITVEGLIAEAEAARTKAMAEKSSLIARRPRRSGYERCGGE